MKVRKEITKSNFQELKPGDSVNVSTMDYLDQRLISIEEIQKNGLTNLDMPQVYTGLVITTNDNSVCITCPNLQFKIDEERFEGSEGDLYRLKDNFLVQITATTTVKSMKERLSLIDWL